jgi:hypothetical protein
LKITGTTSCKHPIILLIDHLDVGAPKVHTSIAKLPLKTHAPRLLRFLKSHIDLVNGKSYHSPRLRRTLTPMNMIALVTHFFG